MPRPYRSPDRFRLGVAWYPEQSDPRDWHRELAGIVDAGFTYVRLAEFAWARIEPRAGVFDFDWLDRAIDAAADRGLDVLLGTPTAAPPAWLTATDPDMLLVEEDGRRARHGARRHFNVASGAYRARAAAIADALGRRYGSHAAVLGFQIDNEYGREGYGAAMRAAFQSWLRTKYRTIDALNAAWFSVFWSRTYDDWRQIDIPRPADDDPGARLDWLRCVTDLWRTYQAAQIDALRPHLDPDKVLTTNFVAHYDEFDFSVPARDLDVVGWDWYHDQPELDPAEGGLLHDLYRGFLDRPPWILESAPGNVVFAARNAYERPGAIRAMMWQAVGHGADGYAFWPWRTPAGGNETLHGSLVDRAGRPRAVLAEVREASRELAALWPELRDTRPCADTLLLHDYESRWSLKREPLTADYDPWRIHVDWYRAFAPHARGMDVRRSTAPVDGYRLILAPALHLVDADVVEALRSAVAAGAHLVLGPRAGLRAPTNQLHDTPAFEALVGAWVDHYETPAAPVALAGDVPGTATVWAERLAIVADGVEALARYHEPGGWLDGGACIVTRPVGRGRITHVGAWLDPPTMATLAARIASAADGPHPAIDVPAGVELLLRAGAGQDIAILINWSPTERSCAIPAGWRLRTPDQGSTSPLRLPRFGVAVLTRARERSR